MDGWMDGWIIIYAIAFFLHCVSGYMFTYVTHRTPLGMLLLLLLLSSVSAAITDVHGSLAHSLLSSNVHLSRDRLRLSKRQADASGGSVCSKCS